MCKMVINVRCLSVRNGDKRKKSTDNKYFHKFVFQEITIHKLMDHFDYIRGLKHITSLCILTLWSLMLS